MRYLLIVFATFFSFSLFAQEICDDGIDNDNDGLIDMNDSDCACSQATEVSLIPNPSFEDHTCCPEESTSMAGASGGINCLISFQSTWPSTTPDYFNTCDWTGHVSYYAPNLLPYPDGSGAVGAFAQDGWQEYIGACLNAPMLAGHSYTLTFNMAFEFMSTMVQPCGANTTNLPLGTIDMIIYGSPSCSEIPFDTYCPTDPASSQNWVELGVITVQPDSIFENWTQTSVTFTPTQDIYAYAFGTTCSIPSDYILYDWNGQNCTPYFLYDNMNLNESSIIPNPISLTITTIYNTCDDLTYTANASESGTFQWYQNGVAISGANTNTLDVGGSTQQTYQVVFTTDDGASCVTEEITYTPISPLIHSVDVYVCSGGYYYYEYGGNDFNITSDITHTTEFGCDSVFIENVHVLPEIDTTVTIVIPSGSDYTYADNSTSTNITVTEQNTSTLNNASINGCDSTVTEIIIIQSAEDCNDGIDNDGDGLIDMNDPDCDCNLSNVGTVTSLIPNPSFEDYTGCPPYGSTVTESQLDLVNSWMQGGNYGTSDYFNTDCGDYFNTSYGTPTDGTGFVGFYSYMYNSWNFSTSSWEFVNYIEFVGTCLPTPLVADTTYNLVFDASFTGASGASLCNLPSGQYPSQVEIAIYGKASCDIPFNDQNATVCPTTDGWTLLGTAVINTNTINTWGTYSFSFTPTFDVAAIIIGPPCSIAPIVDDGFCSPYFLLDNLILNTETEFNNSSVVSITSQTNSCNDVTYTANTTGNGTYQWYYEGVAINGQTNPTLNVNETNNQAGTYQVMFTLDDGSGCVVDSVEFVLEPDITNTINDTICYNESYTDVEGTTYNNLTTDQTYTTTLIAANGCDSIVTENVTVSPQHTGTHNITIPSGSDYTYLDGTTHTNITTTESYTSTVTGVAPNGCDSIITEILSIQSAEDCYDGIDNDGDGLIDINDPDCECVPSSGGSSTEIFNIPNPHLEDNTCCPSTFTGSNTSDGVHCISDWVIPTLAIGSSSGNYFSATPDYINTCGYMPPAATNISPFPSGNGILGAIYSPHWQEYVGVCLTSPIVAGTDYQFDFQLSFGFINDNDPGTSCNVGNLPPIDVTLYGTTNCSDMPAQTIWEGDCPTDDNTNNWVVLGSVTIDPYDTNYNGSWSTASITFNSSIDINAISIGPPCVFPDETSTSLGNYHTSNTNYCQPYFMYDDFQLFIGSTSSSNVTVTITENGSSCANNLTYTATGSTTTGTYQWYFEGVAISGETNPTIDISGNNYAAGTYQVMYTDGMDCVTEEITYTPSTSVTTTIDTSVCSGTDYTNAAGNTETITADQTYTTTLTSVNGCDSIVTENVSVLPSYTETHNINLNAGEDYTYADGTTHTNIQSNESYTSTLTTVDGCDSTIIEILTVGCITPINNPPSYFPNPSFEDLYDFPTYGEMCPTNYSQMTTVDAWSQAGEDATSDYYNTCGYTGNMLPEISPYDGEGCVGFYAYNFDYFTGGTQQYLEYVGTCLNTTLSTSETYELHFNLAFGAFGNGANGGGSLGGTNGCDAIPNHDSLIDITIYGNTDCANLPFYDNNGYNCPVDDGWIVLGSVTIDPMSIYNNWDEFVINFTPPSNISAVILGPPCNLPAGFLQVNAGPNNETCAPYFYLDNLILNTETSFNNSSPLTVDSTGNSCTNLIFTAHINTNETANYQWYYQGNEIVGETDSILDITGNNYQPGTYDVLVTYGSNPEYCITESISFVNLPSVTTTIDTSICSGTDYTDVVGTTYTNILSDISYTNVLTAANGCDSTIIENVTVNPIPTVNAGTDQSICDGTQVTLTAIANPTTSTITWDNGITNATAFTPSLGTTTYNVTATSNGCTSTDAVDVTVNANPTPIISGNDFCEDFSTILDAGSGYQNYDWNPTGANSQTITITDGGIYQVEVTDANGCIGNDDITITMNPTPTIDAGIDVDICNGESTTLTATSSANTFSWDNGLGTGNTQTVSPTNTTIYTVNVTDANGCENSDQVTVNVHSIPTSSISANDISCNGANDGSIDLSISSGTPPYSFQWDNGANTEDINNLSAGNYSVTIQDYYNCSNTNSASIIEPTGMILNLTSNNAGCYGDANLSTNLTVSGGTNPYTYLWNTGETTQNLSNISAGTYIVTVTDNVGCHKISSITINEPNELIVSLPPNFTYCNQTTDLITSVEGGTLPYSYQWSTGETSQNIQYQTNNTATYSVTVTDNNGCTSTEEITISIVSVSLDVFANADTVCPGDPVLVTTNIQGGIPPYTIYDDGQIVAFPVIVYPNAQESYTLQVVDACGNTDIATVDVNVYPLPPLSFSADILQGCSPLTVHFNEESNCYNCSYVWTFDDIHSTNLSLDNNPTHTFTMSGLYDITASVTDGNGCKNQLTIQDMINVYPNPEAMFDVYPEVVSIINSTVEFTNYSVYNYYNFWSFGDGDSSLIENPAHSYDNITNYPVMLVVENEYGCRDTAVHQITVQDIFTLYVPTSFSPDNDGINDGFRAVGHGIDLDNFWIGVYDRWGETIWESTDLFQTWDGIAKNRELVQNGTYKWLVVCKDFNGVEHTKTGNVTVIR